MASIRKEIVIKAPPEKVWAAVRAVGAVHERLVPGLVIDTRLELDLEGASLARVVTFANGLVLRELIVDIDDEAHRLAYASVGGRASHHNASLQVLAEGSEMCRVVWITDVLPHELAAFVNELVEQGAKVMKQTFEFQAS